MSGIARAIKKVFKSDIFKVIVVAAAVWFTAGTASAYFAAPEAGLGAAMSQSASTMWSTTTNFFSASAAESGVADAAVGGAANLGPSVSSQALDTSLVSGGGAQGLDLTLAGNTTAAAVAPAAVAPAAETGMFAWLKANPMATMMLGQAGSGAYGGYLDDKQAQREVEERANRGLFGFDASGKYKGAPATTDEVLAGPESASPATQPQTVATPIVASQQVAPPTTPGQQVPIPREDLTKLIQQGQLARRG